MATAISTDENEHLEMFCLIWLDSNPNEGRNTEQQLRSIINQLKKFQDLDQCQQFIQKTSSKDRLIFIVNGKLGREILPKIHHLRQVISIYIYCLDKKVNQQWSSKYSKVKNIVTTIEQLVSVISNDHRIEKKIEEPLSINIFSVGGKSTVGLNGKFVFSQVLIDCLLRLKSIDQDKNELIHLLKQQYHDNRFELNYIDDFQTKYRPNEALQWYTKECFFYKTLNSVLRTENIHLIFLYRSFIFDLQQQLQKYQSNQILRVYRAQIVSKDELENLKKSINQFISINSFFSTTSNYQKALSFLNSSKSTETTQKILFSIEANPNLVKSKPFANISQLSDFPDEEEVLFMIGSIFQLKKISFDQKNQFSTIEMNLSSDDENQLKQVLVHIKQQTGPGTTNLNILAKILWQMGKLDLAQQYLERFLKGISSDDPLCEEIYEDLAKITSQSGDFDNSMKWHQKSIDFKGKNPTISNVVAGGNGKGDKLNQLNRPQGIYVDQQQQMFIADQENHRILKWKLGQKSGQIVAGGNGKGNRIDQLDRPTDVVVDEKNKSLIICDNGNTRVVRWSLENQQDKQILIQNIHCWGLAMNQNGDLFVSDWNKNEVKRWRKGEKGEGTVVAGGNGAGNQLNQFNLATFIFVDREDSVYVSDYLNHRVMKWLKGAKEGIIVAGGQTGGNSLKQLDCPQGLVVNEVGDVFVVDKGNHRVMCWPVRSAEGRVVAGEVTDPTGLSIDIENHFYVVEYENHRILRFSIDKK